MNCSRRTASHILSARRQTFHLYIGNIHEESITINVFPGRKVPGRNASFLPNENSASFNIIKILKKNLCQRNLLIVSCVTEALQLKKLLLKRQPSGNKMTQKSSGVQTEHIIASFFQCGFAEGKLSLCGRYVASLYIKTTQPT